MVDIAKLFDYEHLYALDLKHPVSEAPLGIVVKVRSAASAKAKELQREHVDEIAERRQRGKLIKGDAMIRRELEQVASYIHSWDWGHNSYGGKKPDMTVAKTAVDILQAEGWMFAQVKEAAETLANFSQGDSKSSAATSGT